MTVNKKSAVTVVLIIVALGAAVFLFVRFQNASLWSPNASPSASVKPVFSQSGDVTSISSTQITIRYLKTRGANGASSVYDSHTIPIIETTPVFKLTQKAQGGGYTETAAKISDIKAGMQVVIQLSDKDGMALFPLRINILPQ